MSRLAQRLQTIQSRIQPEQHIRELRDREREVANLYTKLKRLHALINSRPRRRRRKATPEEIVVWTAWWRGERNDFR